MNKYYQTLAVSVLVLASVFASSTVTAQTITQSKQEMLKYVDDGAIETPGAVRISGTGLFDGSPVLDVLNTSLEASEGFSLGFLGGQNNWTNYTTTTQQPVISDEFASDGTQHIQLGKAGDATSGSPTGPFSPIIEDAPDGIYTFSADVMVTATGGADYDVIVQAPDQGFLTARVRFIWNTGGISVLNNGAFVSTGTTHIPGTYGNLQIVVDSRANEIKYYYNDALIFTGSIVAGTVIQQLVFWSDNWQNTGESGNLDNISLSYEAYPPAPAIDLSRASIDFGTVFTQAGIAEETLSVSNPGQLDLTVGITAPAGFTVEPSSFTVAPGEEEEVVFTFTPDDTGSVNEVAMFTTNVEDSESFDFPLTANVETAEVEMFVFEDFEDYGTGANVLPPNWEGGHTDASYGMGIRPVGGVDDSRRLAVNLFGSGTSLNREGFWKSSFINAGADPAFEFSYRVVNWSGYPNNPTPAANFSLTVVVTSDFGQTYDVLEVIDADNHVASSSYVTKSYDLSAYANETIRVGVLTQQNTGDFWVDFDNVIAGSQPGPVATFDPSELNFGEVPIGYDTQQSMSIINAGTSNLVILSVTTDNAVFTENITQAQIINPGQSLNVNVTYTPVSVGENNANLIIQSNDFVNPTIMIPLSGVGVMPSSIAVNPTSLSADLMVGETATEQLSIINNGEGRLDFSFPEFAAMKLFKTAGVQQNDTRTVGGFDELSKGQEDYRYGNANLLGAGGPDEFGYVWIDSNEAGGPLFNWVEISEVGTELSALTGTWDANTAVELPFEFNFYGESYSSATVSVNGWVNFSMFTGGGFSNTAIPNPAVPNNHVAVLWDDLDMRTQGRVYTHYDGVNFIVQWNEVGKSFGGGGVFTFQAIFSPNGNITYQYLDLEGNVGANTVGIENAAGTDGLQVAFNTPYLESGLAIRLGEPVGFISGVEPVAGSVEPGESMMVDVTFDASGLIGGSYSSSVVIASNDPENNFTSVPVMMDVTGTPAISVSASILEFGDVFIGNAVVDYLLVENTGTDVLTISFFNTDRDAYVVETEHVELQVGQVYPLEIIFAPLLPRAKLGTLSIYNDATSNPVLVQLRGRGIEPGLLVPSTDALAFEVIEGGSDNAVLRMFNNGASNLEYSVGLSSAAGRQSFDDKRTELTAGSRNSNAGNLTKTDDRAHVRQLAAKPANERLAQVERFIVRTRDFNSKEIRPAFASAKTELQARASSDNASVSTASLMDDQTDLWYYNVYDDNGVGAGVNTWSPAVRFTAAELADYYGSHQLSAVRVHIREANFSSVTLKVWEGGSMGNAGTEVYSANVTSDIVIGDYTTHELAMPIMLEEGLEYWVGYEITTTAAGFPSSCDDGPFAQGKGGWIFFQGSWSELPALAPTLTFNWIIRAVVEPSAPDWISIDTTEGVIAPGAFADINVSVSAEELEMGTYFASVNFTTNSPATPMVSVPVSLNVVEAEEPGEMVTFQVDMSVQEANGTFDTSLGDEVYVRGGMNDWSVVDGHEMQNSGMSVYAFTYLLSGEAGASYEYKFFVVAGDGRDLPNDGWEGQVGPNDQDNRMVVLVGADQELEASFFNNDDTPTNIDGNDHNLPTEFALGNNYPNPFNPTTTISYALPVSSDVLLEVYNLQGQRVAVLVNGQQNAGRHSVAFDANRLASGMYLYRMQAGSFVQVQKMMLVK